MRVIMSHRRTLIVSALWLGAVSCATPSTDAGPGVTPPPPVSGPTTTGAALVFSSTVGQHTRIDLTAGGSALGDRLGSPLSYRLEADGDLDGLTIDGGSVQGTPREPTVVALKLTATNAAGAQATIPVRVVAFAAGLPVPVLPSALLGYSDLRAPLPRFLTVVPGIAPGDTSAEAASFARKPNTHARAPLGPVLFYDVRISANDRIACASCHLQSVGFGDTARFSHGFAGGLTRRRAMPVVDLRFRGGAGNGFFWDARRPTLEAVALTPMQDPIEMGNTLANVVAKVSAAGYYQPLFAAAFGSSEITEDRIARALAQYLRSIVTTGSKYDRSFRDAFAPNLSLLNEQESRGQQLFVAQGCAACHFTAVQMMAEPANSGLDAVASDTGAGRGRFRPPSLRNIAIRAPYMHDGRFATLDDVLDFYNNNVHDNPNLDPRLRVNASGLPKRLGLSRSDRDAIIAFLKTLTDSSLIADPRFSDPFRAGGR
jgi:cytochrome c peroxidase